MLACLCLFTFIFQSFFYYLFSCSIPYLNLLFSSICIYEREQWLAMRNIYVGVSVAFTLLTRWQYNVCYPDGRNWSHLFPESLKFPKIWDLVLSSLRYKLHRCRKWKLKSIFSPHKQPRFLWTFYNLYNFSVKSLLNKLWEWRCWWGYWNLLNRKKKWKKTS